MRRTGSTAAVAVVTSAALALTGGCSGDGAEHRDAVRAASARTLAANTAKVAITVRTDVGGTETTLTGEGAYDLGGAKGTLTLDLGSLLAGTKLEARVIADVAYVEPPSFVAGLVGKPFLRIDLGQLLVESPQFGPLSSTANPAASVAALVGAADAEEAGEETVRGEATTRYRGTLDLGDAAADADSTTAVHLSRLRGLLGSDRVPYDVWLDEEGRVRRVTLTGDVSSSPGSATSTGAAVATTVTTELYEYGAAVDVTPPPATDTADGNVLLRTLGAARQ